MLKLLHEGGWTMEQIYAALDVSDKTTHVCVVDGRERSSGEASLSS